MRMREISDGAPAEEWLDVESDGDEDINTDLMTALGSQPQWYMRARSLLRTTLKARRACRATACRIKSPVAVLPFEAKIMHVTVPEGAPRRVPPGDREEHERLPTAPWIRARLCRRLVRVQDSHRR